ncbi:response regulator transcription factor, partial [Propionibacterium sp.]|uniref:response regulator transcription factor n=1 Tax=Propionibacterium sp. TaxID=1977903 RepID=UPI0039EB0DCE
LSRAASAAGPRPSAPKAAPARHLGAAIAAALQGRGEPGRDWAAALEADEDFVQTHLSDGEVQVLIRYAAGETSEAVARHLNLSRSTVNTYIARIRAKYHQAGRPADSRVDLFRRAAEDGLVSYHDSGATTPTRP